jgi:hypothetical protein
MGKHNVIVLTIVGLFAAINLGGCVERQLTINTEPQGAMIVLNDEEIGVSPVTVSFEWYGDYNVTASKEGFETLKTHRQLKGPWYDGFPFDFFTLLNPERTVDSYEWTFELEPKKEVNREALIQKAEELKNKL